MVYLRKTSVSTLLGVSDICFVGNAVRKEPAPERPGMIHPVLQGLSETWSQEGEKIDYDMRHKKKRWNDQSLLQNNFIQYPGNKE